MRTYYEDGKQRETPDAAVGYARINGTPMDRVVRHSRVITPII